MRRGFTLRYAPQPSHTVVMINCMENGNKTNSKVFLHGTVTISLRSKYQYQACVRALQKNVQQIIENILCPMDASAASFLSGKEYLSCAAR